MSEPSGDDGTTQEQWERLQREAALWRNFEFRYAPTFRREKYPHGPWKETTDVRREPLSEAEFRMGGRDLAVPRRHVVEGAVVLVRVL